MSRCDCETSAFGSNPFPCHQSSPTEPDWGGLWKGPKLWNRLFSNWCFAAPCPQEWVIQSLPDRSLPGEWSWTEKVGALLRSPVPLFLQKGMSYWPLLQKAFLAFSGLRFPEPQERPHMCGERRWDDAHAHCEQPLFPPKPQTTSRSIPENFEKGFSQEPRELWASLFSHWKPNGI